MRPLLLRPQGARHYCPDCGAFGGQLPVIDEHASADDMLWALRAPRWLAQCGLLLVCAHCGFRGRAELDVAEDPARPVWRISRSSDEG